jgi:C4-dicarboxylate-specific signal transduction histidine kinase
MDDIVTGIRSTFARKPKERSAVDIGSIVSQALALTQGELESYRIAVKDHASAERSVVLADRVQLQQSARQSYHERSRSDEFGR